jgi:hypothetical protein
MPLAVVAARTMLLLMVTLYHVYRMRATPGEGDSPGVATVDGQTG